MMINIWGLYTYFNISDMMYSHPHWTFSVSKMIKYLWDKKKHDLQTTWTQNDHLYRVLLNHMLTLLTYITMYCCLKTSFILFIGQQLYIQLIDVS